MPSWVGDHKWEVRRINRLNGFKSIENEGREKRGSAKGLESSLNVQMERNYH